MNPVIVMTANDRPWYAIRVLESWRRVRGIETARMIFQCEPHQDMVDLIAGGARYAAQARINVNSRQLGCSGNTRQALLSGFETGADFVIAGEDDGIVTADLLEYMTWAAEAYRDDKDVMAVCTFQDHPPQDTAEVRRVEWFFPPVWGTWADRFSEVEAGWPRVDSIDWARYLHADCMKPRGQVVIQPMATRSQQIGEWGTYQRGSLQEAWDKQQFTDGVGPQVYREIPGVWTSGGDRLR